MLQPIPAIDIIDGKCVRLTKGDYATKMVYDRDPLEFAKRFADLGFKRLHMVDLDGARSQHVVNLDILNRIATHTDLQIDYGGGIKGDDDIKAVYDGGASWATIGSVAVREPHKFDQWLKAYGAQHIILGADTRDGYISINGWKEDSQQTLIDFIDSHMRSGVTHVLCTDISRDGMLKGPAVALYKEILQRFPTCQLIASGGVSGMADLEALDEAGVPYVVFGKAIYEGRIDLNEVAKRFNLK